MTNRILLPAPVVLLAVSALATPQATAQQPQPAFESFATALGEAAGVSEADGVLWGLGPGFKARLDPEGVVFVPTLARESGAARPFALRLESVRRGGAVVASAVPVARERDGDVVTTLHAAGFAERYEVRTDGVEQSFVFPQRLPGTGELVVRCRVETDLVRPAHGEHAGPLRFALDPFGAVTVGAVTGIDARGRRAAGTMRFDGTHLDLVLPAAFVDAAAWPLTLDPLIGSVISFTSTGDEVNPSAAYDESNDLYLVAFERHSAAGWDIIGQRVGRDGSIIGGPISLAVGISGLQAHPTVANVQANNRFLVAWESHEDSIAGIFARAVDAATGAVSSEITVTNTVWHEQYPEACGEATYADDEVIVAWRKENDGIHAAQVHVPSSGDPTAWPEVMISPGYDHHSHDIAPSLGSSGRALIVWLEEFGTYPDKDYDILGRVVDRNLTLGPTTQIATIGVTEYGPSIARDGDGWLVAYGRRDGMPGSPTGIYGRRAREVAGALVFDPEVPLADEFLNETACEVGFTGESQLLAWWRPAVPTDHELSARTVEPLSSHPCEPAVSLAVSSHGYARSAIATEHDGALDGDDALLVYTVIDASDALQIYAVRWEADVGLVSDLGGGCGAGGTAGTGCAVVGNDAYEHRVSGAAASAAAWLVLAFERLDASCGACTLVPDLASAFVFGPHFTDPNGDAAVSTPLPAEIGLVGLTFFDQWIVDTSPGACSAFGVDLSNAIQVEIQ